MMSQSQAGKYPSTLCSGMKDKGLRSRYGEEKKGSTGKHAPRLPESAYQVLKVHISFSEFQDTARKVSSCLNKFLKTKQTDVLKTTWVVCSLGLLQIIAITFTYKVLCKCKFSFSESKIVLFCFSVIKGEREREGSLGVCGSDSGMRQR